MARMNVSLDDALVAEVRRLIPPRQRSRFIAEAVRKELAQAQQERAVRAAAGLWSSEGREDPSEEIREQRQGWQDRQARNDPDRG